MTTNIFYSKILTAFVIGRCPIYTGVQKIVCVYDIYDSVTIQPHEILMLEAIKILSPQRTSFSVKRVFMCPSLERFV